MITEAKMNRKIIVAISYVLSFVFLMSVSLCEAKNAEPAVGDIFVFGRYEQDNNIANGPEPIEWIILEVKTNDTLLLISKYALDAQPYNTEYTDVTWKTCTLREWLNDIFYTKAFDTEEQARILTTKVINENNSHYDTEGGNDTEDKVWLLSIADAFAYFKYYDERMCAPIKYAIAQGVHQTENYKIDGINTCWWWMRSPGWTSLHAARIEFDGSIIVNGNLVDATDRGIRPVIVVQPNS